jgi:hypothetical protein
MVGISAATWPGGVAPTEAKPRSERAASSGQMPQIEQVKSPGAAKYIESAVEVALQEPQHSTAKAGPAATSTETSSPNSQLVSSDLPISDAEQDMAEQDMIVIEDPSEVILPVTVKAPAPVRRKEYRQLFAQLRRG